MTVLRNFFTQEQQIARVELTRVRGSSPREAGARMFVSLENVCGTIGGGQLEYMAIDEARAMMRGGDVDRVMDVPLGPEIGQCCGGRVEVSLHRVGDAEKAQACKDEADTRAGYPHVYVFGAGHVGRALARALALLPVHTILIDSREAELALADGTIEKRLSALPESEVRNARPGSAFIVLTHDHALDFLVASEALQRGDARYVGMIGSKTKRAQFEKWCGAAIPGGIDADGLVCPVGARGSTDKRPEVIAAFAAAEIIAYLVAPMEIAASAIQEETT